MRPIDLGHHGAVAEQHAVAGVEVGQQPVVVDVDDRSAELGPAPGTRRIVVALDEGQALVGHRAGPHLRPGQVDEHADRAAERRLDRAHPAQPLDAELERCRARG